MLSVSALAGATRKFQHYIIFDIPERLHKLNVYPFDYYVRKDKFVQRRPFWSVLRILNDKTVIKPSVNLNKKNITQSLIDKQRKGDVIDKINQLKEHLPAAKGEAVINVMAKFLASLLTEDELRKKFDKIIAKSEVPDDSVLIVKSIMQWTGSATAKRLIIAMKEVVAKKGRSSYEQVAAKYNIRPFELSFFHVALERSLQ